MPIPYSEYVLLCDNPQCKKEIKEKDVAYSEKYSEVYLPNDCIELATGHKAIKLGTIVSNNVDYITREQAIELLKSGKLSQSLEKRLD